MSESQEGYPTTAEDFALFRREAEYWIAKFGLLEWEIGFKHEEIAAAQAQMLCNYEDRRALIVLSTSIGNMPAGETAVRAVARAAFHEVAELILADLSGLAEVRYSKSYVAEETHRVIRRLENAVWSPDWENRTRAAGGGNEPDRR